MLGRGLHCWLGRGGVSGGQVASKRGGGERCHTGGPGSAQRAGEGRREQRGRHNNYSFEQKELR